MKLSIEELKEARVTYKVKRDLVAVAIIDELISIREAQGVPVAVAADIIRDANRYRFLRDEDSWGEDSDSWDTETRTGLISSENLMELILDHFDAAIDARMAASDIPFLNPAQELFTAPQLPVVPEGWQLVPKEPTIEMREAFHESYADFENCVGECPDSQWSAMLSAAPKPGGE